MKASNKKVDNLISDLKSYNVSAQKAHVSNDYKQAYSFATEMAIKAITRTYKKTDK